jgi:hypothetical protein
MFPPQLFELYVNSFLLLVRNAQSQKVATQPVPGTSPAGTRPRASSRRVPARRVPSVSFPSARQTQVDAALADECSVAHLEHVQVRAWVRVERAS